MSIEFFTIERPTRWNAAFSQDMTESEVDRILSLAPFKDMAPENFPRTLSLRNIVRNDTRLRRYGKGEIVVREGDYGQSAFMVVSGEVRVVLAPQLPPSILGRRVSKRKSLLRIIAQLWSNSPEPESFESSQLKPDPAVVVRPGKKDQKDQVHIFLQDVPRLLDGRRTATLQEGEFFGEIAALSRRPRTATVLADEGAELIEIRWQGLRDLMRCDDHLRKHIEQTYHDRALRSHLTAIPLFRHLAEADLQRVMNQTTFGTFGQYEWSGDYKRMAQADPAVRSSQEPTIAREGDYPDGIILVRAGFARLSQRFGRGDRTLNYLGAGQHYGVSEIVHNWRHPEQAVPLQHTLRAMGYTHVLVIPTAVMEHVVLPTIPEDELQALAPPLAPAKGTGTSAGGSDVSSRVGLELFEFLTDNRFFNGTASMVIDLDRCTRCDDCVRACSAAHDNNPRFLRHGPSHGRIMVANACMHCVDPVCLIGCPTGAISRDLVGGQVVINPITCIGCKTCFSNCPYDAIRMVEIRDENGAFAVDQEMKPILKATKCDLCVEQIGGPACQRACPHGALTRMNMNDLNGFVKWLQR